MGFYDRKSGFAVILSPKWTDLDAFWPSYDVLGGKKLVFFI
jgi:hypothetical protein